MPRIRPYITDQKIDYQRRVLTEHCDRLLRNNKISKTKVASVLGISPQAVHTQFANGKITLPTFMAVVSLTDAEPMEIKSILKVGEL